jgi:hypothetical protein
VESHVLEADGPEGRFVIRAEPQGVSTASLLLFNWWWLWSLVRRKARRDHAWVISIRARMDDPLGKPLYQETVPSKGDVAKAMGRAQQRVRSGHVRPDGGGW